MSVSGKPLGNIGMSITLDNPQKTEPICISVVAPVYNEEQGVAVFAEAVSSQLEKISPKWEIVFVNDGSNDRTMDTLRSLREKDSRIKILNFSRNFGNQIATSAGLMYASGDAVITMDSDMQHPPEMIPEMVRLWEEGYHSIYTIRTYGTEVGQGKSRTSSWFGKILNTLSGLAMPEGISDFRLLDRRVVDALNEMGENSRFLRAMVCWLGFRQIGIPFVSQQRLAGETKFSFAKLLKLSIDGILSFSVQPLRWIIYSGFFIAGLSLLYAIRVLIEVALYGIFTPGWPTLIVAVLFLGGIQLIAIGVVGEYVGRVYTETKKRPLFILQEKYGFDTECARSPK